MFIAIANAIGSNRRSPDKIQLLIDAFKARVASEGGVFQAEACLYATLTELNSIV